MGTSYDQDMDVFVLIDQDCSAPGVVLGAATHLGTAMDIADRSEIGRQVDHEPWSHDPDTDTWTRRWAGVWQEIVRIPLAGHGSAWDGTTDPISDMRRARGADLVRLGYAQEVQEIGRTWGAP
jgi:hypothetical protein